MSEGFSFQGPTNRSLNRAHVRGVSATARLEGDRLVITGAESGCVIIAAGAVTRLRVGTFPARYRTVFQTRIWAADGAPILLAVGGDLRGYRDTVRSFAEEVARTGGIERIETGPNRFVAYVVYPLCFLAIGWIGLPIAESAVRTGSAWDWLIAPMLSILIGLGVIAIFQGRPRRVAHLAEIEKLLPVG